MFANTRTIHDSVVSSVNIQKRMRKDFCNEANSLINHRSTISDVSSL